MKTQKIVPYEEEDFLEFVAKTDGSTFKQGSRQNEVNRPITKAEFEKVIKTISEKVEKLEKRINVLEKRNSEGGWNKDEWGDFRLPSSNK